MKSILEPICLRISGCFADRIYLLADLNKEGESNIPLIEVSRGVSFLRLSPMEDFSQSFMEGVQQSMMSLPKLLDKHEAKMQRRRADDDFMRIYDLVDILNLVGCTKMIQS